MALANQVLHANASAFSKVRTRHTKTRKASALYCTYRERKKPDLRKTHSGVKA